MANVREEEEYTVLSTENGKKKILKKDLKIIRKTKNISIFVLIKLVTLCQFPVKI